MRDWTPRLIGHTYCSPACGMGCTKAAYDQAHEKALALAKRMDGKAWTIRVWENLGWHYELERRDLSSSFRCTISESIGGVYSCYFWSDPQIVTKASDPNTALELAIMEARRRVNRILDDIALFPEIRT